MPPIFRGTLVSVNPQTRRGRPNSEGGFGTVKKKKKRKDDGAILTQDSVGSGVSLFDVKYSMDGRLSQNVERKRIDIAMFGTAACRRSEEDEVRPSLLQMLNASSTRRRILAPKKPPRKAAPRLTKHSTAWLLSHAHKKDSKGHHVHVAALQDKKKTVESGWLRDLEFRLDPESAPKDFVSSSSKPRFHLTTKEKEKAFKLSTAATPHDSARALVGHAWGVARQSVHGWNNNVLDDPGTKVSRKKRSDAGSSVFTSDKKRRSLWNPLFVFGKLLRKEHPDSTFTQQQIDEQWTMATAATVRRCNKIADQWVQQGPFLIDETCEALDKTAGSVSWQAVATLVSGSGNLEIASNDTVRTFVMGLPDSTHKSTRILPKLDKANKQRRLDWAHQFFMFWKSATAFNRVQIVLVHRDEKWFWSIVVRRKLKSVPFFGIEPVMHGVQHKSHLEKIMGVASTAFVPENNDIANGGKACLVNLIRVGRMVAAQKDTHKRVCRDDGTYHYPKVPENRLRQQGQLCFKAMEITGSNKGTPQNPKFDLLSCFKDTEIPKLENIALLIGAQTGERVVVRDQMDSAGPHTCKKLISSLTSMCDRLGWQIVFQPSNSPVTNVKDDCVFPALSKHVTAQQGVTEGSQVFTPDELWEAVEQCWLNFPLDTLARSCVRHCQIAAAIAHCQGGDNFVRNRNGLHCHVRNCCVPVCNEAGVPTGVEVVQAFETEEGNEQESNRRKLRCEDPDLEPALEEQLAKMRDSELQVLHDQLPAGHEWVGPIGAALLAKNESMFEHG